MSDVLDSWGASWLGDPIAELGLFRDCTTDAETRAVLREQVGAEVEAMLTLVAEADAFDVIELMRMREFPLWPDPTGEHEGAALAVEIVAAVLLSREGRKPDGATPRPETRPHEAISELHERALRLGRLATYRNQFASRLSDDPLAELAADYQSAVLNIRNLQYDTIRKDHEQQLFGHPTVTDLMNKYLGYTYGDVLAVREAMFKMSGDRITRLRDATAEVLQRFPNTAPANVPQEALAEFMAAMVPFMFLPADRAVFTAEEVAAESGVQVDSVTAVLASYSQAFDDSRSAVNRVYGMLSGTNPFQVTPLVGDGAGGFVATTNGVGLDSLRRVVEAALTGKPEWHRYDKKVRQVVSERLTLSSLEQLLKTPPKFAGFSYFAPLDDEDHAALGSSCADLGAVAKLVQADGLFVVGDVAICVEVKGKSMAAQARRGDVARLWRDMKATVGDGCTQAVRLQSLIETNGGLWLEDRTWLDLSKVREVRSVVALLDDVGPLGTRIGELQRVGLVPAERTPWITSIHDLQTIALVCDRPSEFLLYLRRRADSEVAEYYRSADELDLFMLFMDAELYVEPDPDQVRAEHPSVPPVRNRDRRAHARDAAVTFVGDQCQELNAWMDRDHRNPWGPQPVKPSYNAVPELLALVDKVEEHGGPGMLRFGADMLAMSGLTQRKLMKSIAERVRASRRDGLRHDEMHSYAGCWGHPTVFIMSRPRSSDLASVQRHLLAYMRLKRHQLRSDRSYGFVFDESSNLEVVIYLNGPVTDDRELDALVEQAEFAGIGDDAPPPVPPAAKRATRQLRGKKRRR